MPNNKILTSGNAARTVTNLAAIPSTSTLEGVPLGTAGDSATGELGVKVLLLSTGGTTGTFTAIGPVDIGDQSIFPPVVVGGVDGSGNVQNLSLTTSGVVNVTSGPASAATLANKSYSGSNQTLAASNANRRGLLLFNDTDGNLFVKFGATATTSSFTVKVLAGGYYEMPSPVYTGIVDGIGTAGTTGATRVTELT